MRFYQLQRDDVLFRLPCAQGWAMYAWSEQNNGQVEMELTCPGYIGQEAAKRRSQKR